MNEQTAPHQDSAESPVIVSRDGRVGRIQLNRPKALNALNAATMEAVVAAAVEFDADPEVGAILLLGSEKAFAAACADTTGPLLGHIDVESNARDMDLLRAHPHSAPSSEGMADRRRHPAYRTELLPDTPGPAGPTDAERGGPR